MGTRSGQRSSATQNRNIVLLEIDIDAIKKNANLFWRDIDTRAVKPAIAALVARDLEVNQVSVVRGLADANQRRFFGFALIRI